MVATWKVWGKRINLTRRRLFGLFFAVSLAPLAKVFFPPPPLSWDFNRMAWKVCTKTVINAEWITRANYYEQEIVRLLSEQLMIEKEFMHGTHIVEL